MMTLDNDNGDHSLLFCDQGFVSGINAANSWDQVATTANTVLEASGFSSGNASKSTLLDVALLAAACTADTVVVETADGVQTHVRDGTRPDFYDTLKNLY